MVVMLQDRVWNVSVRDNLDRAVVVLQLLGSDDVRVVAMNGAIHADNALHHTCNGAQIVRHHNYRHTLVQTMQERVEFVLELVVHKVRRLVKNQQFRL